MIRLSSILMIAFMNILAISVPYGIMAEIISKEYTGKLQAGGTSFDDFILSNGDELQIDKSNPDIKDIYKYCGYDENCIIKASVKDGMIMVINKATKDTEVQQHGILRSNGRVEKYPTIHGLNLSMGYDEAKNAVRALPIDGEHRAAIFVYPEGGDTRSFIFFDYALKELYNRNNIDHEFLHNFLATNNLLNGKLIDFETFSQKFMKKGERENKAYGIIPTIAFFGGLFGVSNSTIFWDCGNYCVVFAPDNSPGHPGYIGFVKSVDQLPQ